MNISHARLPQRWHAALWAIPDVVWAPVVSGILMVVPGVLSLVTAQAWLFPSLGPTAFLQAQAPDLQMSRLYNTIAGHSIGIIAGYISVFALGLNGFDGGFVIQHLSTERMWASVIAVTLTVAGQIPLRATHAPAVATTLLISLGGFTRKWVDVLDLLMGIVIVAAIGELFRWLRTARNVPLDG